MSRRDEPINTNDVKEKDVKGKETRQWKLVKGFKMAEKWAFDFAYGVVTVAALATFILWMADFIVVDLMHKERNPMYTIVMNFWLAVGNQIGTNLVFVKDTSYEWLSVVAPNFAMFLVALKRQVAIEITYVCMRIINYLDVLSAFKTPVEPVTLVGIPKDWDPYGIPH
jgi:hypothetical protein